MVVLVHGWGASAATWDPVVALLPPEWECVAVTLPAHGDLRQAADEVVERLTRPATLVGHSMGGQVTALVHTARPDLVRAEVVIEPAYGMPDDARHEVVALHKEISDRGHAALEAFVAGAFSAHASPQLRESIWTDVVATPVATLAAYLDDEYLRPHSIGLATPARALLAGRTAPVLGLFSSAEAAAFERVGGADIEIWDGHGHYLHQEDPARFAASLVRWASAAADRAGVGEQV